MPDPWLCIHHRADDGARVRLALRREGIEVHWPRCVVRQPRKDDVLRPLFPGYLFARTAQWSWLRAVPNVIGVVGVRERGVPSPMPTGVVEALIAEAGGAMDGVIDLTPDATVARGYKRGDKLRVVSGPLAGLLAEFRGDHGTDRVAVLLSILGGQTAAVMRRDQVEAADAA